MNKDMDEKCLKAIVRESCLLDDEMELHEKTQVKYIFNSLDRANPKRNI